MPGPSRCCSEDLCQRAAHAAAANVLQRVDVGVVQRRHVPPAKGARRSVLGEHAGRMRMPQAKLETINWQVRHKHRT